LAATAGNAQWLLKVRTKSLGFFFFLPTSTNLLCQIEHAAPDRYCGLVDGEEGKDLA